MRKFILYGPKGLLDAHAKSIASSPADSDKSFLNLTDERGHGSCFPTMVKTARCNTLYRFSVLNRKNVELVAYCGFEEPDLVARFAAAAKNKPNRWFKKVIWAGSCAAGNESTLSPAPSRKRPERWIVKIERFA